MNEENKLFFGILGVIVAGVFLIPLYYVILPFEWGAWLDGFPFSLIVSIPGYLVGSIVGVVVGRKNKKRINNHGLMVFISAFFGGVLGSMIISFFVSVTFFL